MKTMEKENIANQKSIQIERSWDANGGLAVTKKYMLNTQYWSGQNKQTITPDFLIMNKKLIDELEIVGELEINLLNSVTYKYKEDIRNKRSSRLIKYIEGDLKDTETMKILRDWILAVPEDLPVNYFRPDMGIDTQENPYLCELNIITAGTPPAILYREAQESIIQKQLLRPATDGSVQFFWELGEKDPNKSLTILGVSPIQPNQVLYEKSHADMANCLKELNINANFVRITDLQINNGLLYVAGSKTPVSLVYWRIPPFQRKTLSELNSPQGRLLLKLYKEKRIAIYPTPALPFMNNKALEVIVWDDIFSDLAPNQLKKFVPETKWLDKRSKLFKDIIAKKEDWRKYVIKRARGDGGVTLGKETSREDFTKRMIRSTKKPMQAVIQIYIPPARFPFRTKYGGGWKSRDYFIRIEPTMAVDTGGNLAISDLFFTGRYDTQKVGGGKECIMGTVCTRIKT